MAASASLELFAFFSPKLSDFDDSAISIVFQNIKQRPTTRDQDPRNQNPKTQDSKNQNSENQDPETWDVESWM